MLHKFRELGDVKFIINVGDSFYPGGVESRTDPQWDTKWRSVYAEELRAVPWYSVYGNHDYHKDPCACGAASDCAQVNADIDDKRFFYMPGPNWFKDHPELETEVVALDLNLYMDAWNHKQPFDPLDCQYTPCQAACKTTLRERTQEALELFDKRINASRAKNLIVFSHYPTDYLWGAGDMLEKLRSTATADGDGHRHVEFYGGHRHNVDQHSTTSIAPNNNWVVGGGGGWSCDGGSQGFVVGEISKDYAIKTYSVLVPYKACCR
jgi:hypothetical protein